MAANHITIEQMKAVLKARDDHVRESWIRAMELRLIKEQLDKCYKVEGVNHNENCRSLVDRYLGMLQESRVKGYKNVDV